MRSRYSNITSLEEVLIKVQKEIDEKKLITNCLEESLVKEIRNILPIFSAETFEKAWNEDRFHNRSQLYELVRDDIIGLFFPYKGDDKPELQSITCCGIDSYAYAFRFGYKGFNFEINIPVHKRITEDNRHYTYNGRYVVRYEERSCIWDFIKASYEPKEIKTAIEKFIKEHTEG